MFKAQVVTVRDPFHPMRNREIRTLECAGPISALAPETKQPFIILRNGQAVLRADWDQPVADGDLMAVVLLPQGGDNGGSDVLRVVLMIVVLVVAWYAAPYLAAYAGVSVSVAQSALGIVGMALVNAVLPPPEASINNGGMTDFKAASPTYNIGAQGNAARIGGAIPIQYGRLNVFPDFAAMPYVEYEGNEQYLYQLLCIGAGEYDIEQIRVEDSPISAFEEITYEILPPNTSLSLFPAAVGTSGEVSGQEMTFDVALGPFVANTSGTLANRIAFDVVCPRGLYYAENSGALSTKSISFQASYRLIDDDGVAIGSWVDLAVETVSGATSTPQRYTFGYPVANGRYEVKIKRTTDKDVASRAGHEIVWAGLRTHLVSPDTFGNVTLLAMKMRATNNLSSQSARKINVTCTRKLYSWSGSAWVGPTATRSPAWALADACHTVGITDSRIDLDALVALDAIWASRGDKFDGRFDSTSTFWESLTKIAQAGRCKPYMQGGIVHFMRDQSTALPVALYSMRNIVRGSFSLNFMTPTDDTADAVQVTYFDESTWKPRTLTCSVAGSTSEKPAKVELFGVVNRDHAFREGTYMAAANRYRRTIIKFSTEMEGFIPSYGDLVAINHDLPQWGQHAEAVAFDDTTNVLTLSEPMTWGSGTHYIGLRRRDGSLSGPYVVTAGENLYKVVLATEPDFTIYTGQEEERTHAVFGWGETWRQLARVVAIRPKDELTVELTCINEDSNVHTADVGITTPAIVSSQLPATPLAPTVTGLSARTSPSEPGKIIVTWQPAAGAQYYIIDQSSDGVVWSRAGQTTTSNFLGNALYGTATIIRVAAVGDARGSWATATIHSDATWQISALSAEQPFTGRSAKIKWDVMPGAVYYRVEVWASGVVKRTVSTGETRFEYGIEDSIADGGPYRSIEFRVFAINESGAASSAAILAQSNPQVAMATSITAVSAGSSLSISADMPTVADFSGAKIWISATAGFDPTTTPPAYIGPNNFYTTPLTPGTYYYRIAFYDVFGTDGINISSESSIAVAGSAGGIDPVATLPVSASIGRVVFLTTDNKLYRYTSTGWSRAADGGDLDAASVTADRISVANLAAMSANLGSVTAGSLTLDATGFVRGGATGYLTGAGFWMGYHSGQYKFHIGDPTTDYLAWTGSSLTIKGVLNGATGTFAGALSAATGSFAGSLTAASGTLGALNIASGGNVKMGQTAFNTGTGFWLGDDGGTPKLSFGNPSGGYFTWDGSNIIMAGAIMDNRSYTAGSVPICVDPLIGSKNFTTGAINTYYLVKEIYCPNAGTLTVSFSLGTTQVNNISGRIYKNGVAAGTVRTVTNGGGSNLVYTTFSENITVTAGQLLQIYVASANITGGVPAYVKEFKTMCGFPGQPCIVTRYTSDTP